MTRAERHAYIIQTIAAGVATADQITAMTGVCARTIYRDMKALRAGGNRILSGPGKGAGYLLKGGRS